MFFLGKAGIAHRDLKSKNILVKSSGVCCIADLGKLSTDIIIIYRYTFIHLLLRTRQQITSTKHTERLKTYTVNTAQY